MGKLIVKLCLFAFPILLLQAFTFLYYSPDKGDLLRIGYIIDRYPDYRSAFSEEYEIEMKVTSVREIKEGEEYDILTIGDSYSDQGNVGYQNYLALSSGLKMVHLDRYFHSNQIQALTGLANSDFFDRYRFNFVLLQFIEGGSRGVIGSLDSNALYPLERFSELPPSYSDSYSEKLVIPSDRIIKFPFYSFKRTLFPELACNFVYALPLKTNPFSINEPTLYFHSFNPQGSNNNDEMEIKALNSIFNQLERKLESKGVKLIVMPVPDKLDFYFSELENTNGFQNTRFFEVLNDCQKNYIYIDPLRGLKEKAADLKDVYYFDDTHWSPIGSKIVAQLISKSIL